MQSVGHCGNSVRFRSTSANRWLDHAVILKLPRKHCKEQAIDSLGAMLPAGIFSKRCSTPALIAALRTGDSTTGKQSRWSSSQAYFQRLQQKRHSLAKFRMSLKPRAASRSFL